MLTSVLRKSGGSVTVTIPSAIMSLLEWAAQDVVVVEIAGQSLVLKKRPDGKGRPAPPRK
jgi:antitoxin component of MazEF toxin-antitoxin module